MTRHIWSLVLLGLTSSAWPLPAEEPPKSGDNLQPSLQALGVDRDAPGPSPFSSVILQDPFTTLNGRPSQDTDSTEGNGKGAPKKGPKHIRDNAFLVEEAFNQEPGEVQHIFNWINLWDQNPEGRTRDFAFAFTMELPLGSQAHQFSFTTQFLTAFEKPKNGPATQQGDVGDTFINYRYQLLADDEFLWSAPRFSLILPTGDKRLGLGTGELGYQFNLPVSKYGDWFDYHFNGGVTYIPNVSVPLEKQIEGPGRDLPENGALLAGPRAGQASPRHDLHGYNLGASVFWKPRTYLHFFVEGLALWIEGINELGFRERNTLVFVNPGVRYAVIQDPVEWVIGVAVPLGLTRDSPDFGIFAYMSVEHPFRKKKEGGPD